MIVVADTAASISAVLSVGSSDQTVEVLADQVPQLKTDRADVSTIYSAQDIESLPIPDHNFFTLDGTDNQDAILGIIVINPNTDSMSDVKITTQNYDAEFGKAVASVDTISTKSGSNQFHGTAFDNRESSSNLARDPFSSRGRFLLHSRISLAVRWAVLF